MDEHICDFKIPVDDILFSEIQQSFENVSYHGLCSLLGKELSSPELGLEIALITKFRNNVTISVAGEDFKAPQNVRMVELLKYVDFGKQQLLQFLRLERV